VDEAPDRPSTPAGQRSVSGQRLDYPRAPVWAILAGAAWRWPRRVALRQDGCSVTWSELWSRSRSTATALQAAGLAPGDVVAIRLPNGIEFAQVYWAAQLCGLTTSPVNPRQPPAEAQHQIEDCGARLVITVPDDDFPAPDGVNVVTPDDLRPQGAPLDGWVPHHPADLATAVAHISYTGGTTGVPKGVLVSQRSVVCNALQFSYWATGSLPGIGTGGGVVLDQIGGAADWPVRLGTGTVIAVAPWFHAMGLIGGVVLPALQGSTSLIPERFDPASFIATVEAARVSSVSGAPALLAALAARLENGSHDVSSVRLVSCGGGPLAPVLADRLSAVFPDAVITQAYGLTEVTMAAVGNPTGRGEQRRRGSVGVPMPDTEIRLLPPADDAEEAEDGRGEIVVRGPQIMLGYHGRPDATEEILRDGWLHTGDIGVLDKNGYLSIVDRQKDMLIYKGYNVYPSELEALLRKHPGVRDAAVVGAPDPDVGDVPVAFVVPASPEALDPGRLADAVNAQVVHYKKLREVVVVESLPTSAVGKVVKGPLRAEAARRAGTRTG
jgi:long-chain acyl-CoA synthetase